MIPMLLAMLLLVFSHNFVSAQEVTVTGGAVAGTIISASTEVPGTSTVQVLSVPATGSFVLTTVCAGPFAVSVSAQTFGPLSPSTVKTKDSKTSSPWTKKGPRRFRCRRS